MATAINKNYSSESGIKLYGGIQLPTWVTSQTVNTFKEIPLVAKLSDVNPANDVLINPNHPSPPEWDAVVGQSAIISAWCGACFSESEGKLYFILNGGHADYAGNESYVIDINSEEPTTTRLNKPSGAIGNLLTTNDGQETSGVYADGRVRSPHSYNYNQFVDGVGAMMHTLGKMAWSAGQASIQSAIRLNESTGEKVRLAANPVGGDVSGAGSCYDPSRHVLWSRGSGVSNMMKYDIATNTYSAGLGGNFAGAQTCAMTYLHGHDLIFVTDADRANGFFLYDPVDGAIYEPDISGSFLGMVLNGWSQPVHAHDRGFVAVWNNTSNTTAINRLIIPANPKTDTWVIDQLPIDAGNAVTPTVAAGNGTFGRFFYSAVLQGFGFINATNQNPYFFKLGAI